VEIVANLSGAHLKNHIAAILAAALAVASVPTPVGADVRVSHAAGHASKKTADADEPTAGPPPVDFLATLVQTHTEERVVLTEEGPSTDRFAQLLCDRVTGTKHALNPLLLELLRMLGRKYPAARIELVSGFRSPKLNEMMRKKGHHVASHSQHSLGHAVDFRIVPDGALRGIDPRALERELRDLGWLGGIGVYPTKDDWFVHADVGPQRRW
jgi:uncharacterized protein YcbK (DUF882 family)